VVPLHAAWSPAAASLHFGFFGALLGTGELRTQISKEWTQQKERMGAAGKRVRHISNSAMNESSA
jgi:hypothetical protein